MKVQCPNCKKVCHKTNESFNSDVRPNGGMVDLLQPWLSYGWGKFGEDSYGGSGVMASDMLCPLCQGALAPSGRLNLVSDDHQEVLKPKTLEQLNQERINSLVLLDSMFNDPPVTMSHIVAEYDKFQSLPQGIDDKPFMCLICGWAGKTEAALKRHRTMNQH